jgi:hypothetical protein
MSGNHDANQLLLAELCLTEIVEVTYRRLELEHGGFFFDDACELFSGARLRSIVYVHLGDISGHFQIS